MTVRLPYGGHTIRQKYGQVMILAPELFDTNSQFGNFEFKYYCLTINPDLLRHGLVILGGADPLPDVHLQFGFNNILLICVMVDVKNVVFKHTFICSLNTLFILKFEFIIYPIEK